MELMQKYPIAVDLSAWRTSNTGPQIVMQLAFWRWLHQRRRLDSSYLWAGPIF